VDAHVGRDEGDREALERELYWAEDGTPRGDMGAQQIRVALREFAALLRADERAFVPHDEPQLSSQHRWRSQLKVGIFVVLRPMRRRYDRLLGELSELVAILATRVAEQEAELAGLRAQREGSGSDVRQGRGGD
jgi:hypothetical protein